MSEMDITWYRWHGIFMAAPFAVLLPVSFILGRCSLVTPARRFFLLLHVVTSLAAFLAVGAGLVVLYWKIPDLRSIDKLKTRHGSIGAGAVAALILIAVNSCICFPNRKTTKRSFGWILLHKTAGVLVVLAAGYVSYIGIGTYDDLTGASQPTLYIGAYGGCTGLLLFLYFILLFIPARDPSRLALIAKDFDMVSASNGSKKNKHKPWPPADISWPSSHRAMLAAGNFEQLPKLGASAQSPLSVTARVPASGFASPSASASDMKDIKQAQPDLETGGVSNTTGEQQSDGSQGNTLKNRGKGSPSAPTMSPLSATSNASPDIHPLLPKGETTKNEKSPESSSQATSSTRDTVSSVLVDSGEIRRIPNVSSSYTSITDSEGSRFPGTVSKQIRPKPSELESVDLDVAPPRKPRHPGDKTVVL